MSQYYISRTKRQSISGEASQRQGTSASNTRDSSFSSSYLAESAVYIFPDPSSAPPSPIHSSDLSTPTEFTLSTVDLGSEGTDRSYLSSPESRPSGLVTSSPSLWEWIPDIPDIKPEIYDLQTTRSSLAAHTEECPRDILDYCDLDLHRRGSGTIRSRGKQHDSRNTVAEPSLRPSSNLSSDDPPDLHRSYFPFLSLIVSVFSIDQATVELLASSSSQSALFPCSDLLETKIKQCQTDGTDVDNKALHGVRKLLVHQNPHSQQSLKEGLIIAADFSDDSLLSLLPSAPSLLDLMNGLVTHSGQALRGVFRHSPKT